MKKSKNTVQSAKTLQETYLFENKFAFSAGFLHKKGPKRGSKSPKRGSIRSKRG
jgi:hypothetical protein